MGKLDSITSGYGKMLNRKPRKKKFKIEVTPTPRGFLKGEFDDLYGAHCSIQESSLATDDAIWLGVDNANPQIMVTDAKRLGIPVFADNGWVAYPVPEQVHFTTRMHLNKEQAKELMKLLRRFIKNGRLTK